ncbi:MAG: lysostaphin resistance A-like protein [Dysgonomonas sp.]
MRNKALLYNMDGRSQFFFFCFLSFIGYIFAISILLLVFDMAQVTQSASMVRIAMIIQSVCLFFVPSLAFGYLCQENPMKYFKIESVSKHWPMVLLLSIFLIIVIQPFIFSISYYNQQMVLPESMTPLENWMREAEFSAEKSLNLLFVDKTAIGLILNLCILAVIAGLVEELFFRGCLQQIIQKIFINKHAAIWITAFIFSAIHFQFYGFVPRLLLGALLGYLYFWSGNLWVPILVHTTHNALNVILTHIYIGTPEYEQMQNFSFENNTLFILISFVFATLVLYIIYRKSQQQFHDSEN